MYGVSRVLGVGPPVTLRGRSYRVRARTIGDYAQIEARMLQLRGNPFDILRWIGSKDEPAVVAAIAKLRDGWWNVRFGECVEWLETWEGRIWALWLATRDDGAALEFCRECVLEACDNLRDQEAEAWWYEIQEAMEMANGTDELGLLASFRDETSSGTESVQWPLVFRFLGEEPFSFTPQTVAEMTIEQISIYQSKRERLSGPEPPRSHQGMVAFTQRQEDFRRKAAASLVAGKTWNAR